MTIPSLLEPRKDYPVRPFQLPNGELTNDAAEYLDAWHAIIDPFQEKFNVRVTSFGPHVSFVDKPFTIGNPNVILDKEQITVPVWFVERLINYDPLEDE